MTSVLRDNLPFPGTEDPTQITRNLLRRTHAGIALTLSSEENTALWRRLMVEEAGRSGTQLDELYGEVTRILPQIRFFYNMQEGKLDWIGDRITEMTVELEKIGVEVSDAEKSSARAVELLTNLTYQPLNATAVGEGLVGHYKDATTAAVKRDPHAEAMIIEELLDIRRLAMDFYISSPVGAAADYRSIYVEATFRHARLRSGKYTMDDLKYDDLMERLNNLRQ